MYLYRFFELRALFIHDEFLEYSVFMSRVISDQN